MASWLGEEQIQKEIEAAGFHLLQAYLAAAALCPKRPCSEDQPMGDPSYTCTLATRSAEAQVTFTVEYTEGPTNYQLTFESVPYGPEKVILLLVALSDVTTYVLATFASLQYEEIVLIYNTPNVTIEALPPSVAQLQTVLQFLGDPDMAPGGCASPEREPDEDVDRERF